MSDMCDKKGWEVCAPCSLMNDCLTIDQSLQTVCQLVTTFDAFFKEGCCIVAERAAALESISASLPEAAADLSAQVRRVVIDPDVSLLHTCLIMACVYITSSTDSCDAASYQ